MVSGTWVTSHWRHSRCVPASQFHRHSTQFAIDAQLNVLQFPVKQGIVFSVIATTSTMKCVMHGSTGTVAFVEEVIMNRFGPLCLSLIHI